MFAEASDKPSRFGSSRSVVCGTRGIAATSQPLAAYEAIRVLEDGGNAIDAAVTASILLGVLEPMQIGLGGDLLALVHDGRTGETHALNGSGRAGSGAGRDAVVHSLGGDATAIPLHSIHAVTVPGAVDGWLRLLDRFGRIDRARAFSPAIRAAEQGFAVAPQTAATWAMGTALLERQSASRATWLLSDGKAPRAGELFKNPKVARHLRLVSDGGRDAFYAGPGAAAIVQTVTELGGFLTADDFRAHQADWVDPMTARYRDCTVMEMPPNSQGVAVLEALALLDHADLKSLGFGSADAIRLQIEAVRAAMADSNAEVADADHLRKQRDWFLDASRVHRLWRDIERGRRVAAAAGSGGGDTAFVAVADHEGSFAAVIGSLFVPWATGITAGDSGILLQNRGAGFSLDPAHPNVIAPGKRPRHTILPALIFREDRPVMAMGFVGGDMQVQAQVQFLCNLLDFDMNPQEALDAPRWRYEGRASAIALEEPLLGAVGDALARAGYEITGNGGFFGGGQAVLRHPDLGTLQGVSDGRRDGAALGL